MNIAPLFRPDTLQYVVAEFNSQIVEFDEIPMIELEDSGSIIFLYISPETWEIVENPDEFWVKHMVVEFENGVQIGGQWIEDFKNFKF